MKSRHLRPALALPGLLTLSTLPTMESAAAAPLTQPNILVVVLDDAGYNDFGFMGSEDLPSPNIDRLAGMGAILTDGHVTATTCSPSRAAILTGRYQQRFGHESNVPPSHLGMCPEETTIADALRTAGYRTQAIGKWHVGNKTMFHPNNRGFDDFWGFLEGSRSYFPDPEVDQPGNYRAILHNRRQVDFEGYLTDEFTDRALEFMEASGDQPWFIYLSYNTPHTPMEAKEEHLEKFEGHPRRELAAMLWSLDENMGRITDYLESQGTLENTLIFFFSDNGGAGHWNNQTSNYPLKGWKGNKFEGGHRVPFFVTWPAAIPGGQRYDGLSSSLDVMATSIAAAGLQRTPGKPLDGVDLVPFLRGDRAGPPHHRLYWRKDRFAAMRDGPFKLIRVEGYGYRLYNLEEDLAETDDLRESHPEVFARMKAALIAWDQDMVLPLWYEGEDWTHVTYESHRALMNNRAPRYRSPWEREAFLRRQRPQAQ